jgi:hypothetical protein
MDVHSLAPGARLESDMRLDAQTCQQLEQVRLRALQEEAAEQELRVSYPLAFLPLYSRTSAR